jgi:hypothetical protein
MAINLQETFTKEEGEKPNADALFDFIAEFYGNKVKRDDLKRQTDLIECLSVLQAIITRASALTREFARANPPVPSPKKK